MNCRLGANPIQWREGRKARPEFPQGGKVEPKTCQFLSTWHNLVFKNNACLPYIGQKINALPHRLGRAFPQWQSINFSFIPRLSISAFDWQRCILSLWGCRTMLHKVTTWHWPHWDSPLISIKYLGSSSYPSCCAVNSALNWEPGLLYPGPSYGTSQDRALGRSPGPPWHSFLLCSDEGVGLKKPQAPGWNHPQGYLWFS